MSNLRRAFLAGLRMLAAAPAAGASLVPPADGSPLALNAGERTINSDINPTTGINDLDNWQRDDESGYGPYPMDGRGIFTQLYGATRQYEDALITYCRLNYLIGWGTNGRIALRIVRVSDLVEVFYQEEPTGGSSGQAFMETPLLPKDVYRIQVICVVPVVAFDGIIIHQ